MVARIARTITALVFSIGMIPAIAAAAAARCGAPADLHDGWKVAAPAQEGLDPKLICAIGPRLEKMTEADPHAVVVVRHGVLVYEHYFTGGTEFVSGLVVGQVNRDPNTLHSEYSVTKSVTALLTGIAFDRGWLKNIDVPVFSFLPQYADLRTPEKSQITLRDLLTMSSGLAWPENAVSYASATNPMHQMSTVPDPFRFLLGRSLAATPGTLWNYNSGAVELLGVILEKASGPNRQNRAVRPARHHPFALGSRVLWVAAASARSGEDRAAGLESWRLERTSHRLRRLDQGDDDAAHRASFAMALGPRIRLICGGSASRTSPAIASTGRPGSGWAANDSMSCRASISSSPSTLETLSFTARRTRGSPAVRRAIWCCVLHSRIDEAAVVSHLIVSSGIRSRSSVEIPGAEARMAARILLTLGALLLALNAFWGDAFGLGWRVNPFGLFFLLLAAGIWFGWGAMRDSYRSSGPRGFGVGPMMDRWQGALLMRFANFGDRDPARRPSSGPETD